MLVGPGFCKILERDKMEERQIADIPESFFQYRAELKNPLLEAWTVPNKIITALMPLLKKWDVGLGDVSWAQANNLRDLQVTFGVPKLRSGIKVGLDSLTFDAANPDWLDAPKLLEFFQAVTDTLRDATSYEVVKQEAALAMHVKSGKRSSKDTMQDLVCSDRLGPADSYGVSMYRSDSSCVIDKSLRYEGAFFIRLQRTFEASVTFPELALGLYNDEIAALSLLGLTELLPSQEQ